MRTIKKILFVMLLVNAVPCWAQAQPRIAWLWPGTFAGNAMMASAFKEGMRDNGMMEGKHYTLDERYADGQYDRFPGLVNDLLKNNPLILMVNTIASVLAAQRATKTVPIVFVATNDPVGSGLVASLSHPGGNTTGLSNQNEDVIDKYAELLNQVLPRASRIAILSNPDNPSCPKLFERLRMLLNAFGKSSKVFEASSPKGLEAIFSEIARYRPHVLLVLPEAMFYDQRAAISAFVTKEKIPAIVSQIEFATLGCLISYSANRLEMFRRSAIYVRKILADAKPADLPVEQPTKFELAINVKTAKAFGITIPQSILLRADKVIE